MFPKRIIISFLIAFAAHLQQYVIIYWYIFYFSGNFVSLIHALPFLMARAVPFSISIWALLTFSDQQYHLSCTRTPRALHHVFRGASKWIVLIAVLMFFVENQLLLVSEPSSAGITGAVSPDRLSLSGCQDEISEVNKQIAFLKSNAFERLSIHGYKLENTKEVQSALERGEAFAQFGSGLHIQGLHTSADSSDALSRLNENITKIAFQNEYLQLVKLVYHRRIAWPFSYLILFVFGGTIGLFCLSRPNLRYAFAPVVIVSFWGLDYLGTISSRNEVLGTFMSAWLANFLLTGFTLLALAYAGRKRSIWAMVTGEPA